MSRLKSIRYKMLLGFSLDFILILAQGTYFLDYRNDIKAENMNTVVYGHRMKDGSMFQHLTKLLDEDILKEHQTFECDTLYDNYEAEIFSVYNTLTDFNYIETEFPEDQ